MNSPRTTLYRDKNNAKLMGVCSGIADYTGINVFWVRMIAFFSMFPTGGWSILAYFIAGFALSPKRTAREIRAAFRDVDRRLAAVETHYVSSNPRLTAEIERLR
jgi:phage shock protein C